MILEIIIILIMAIIFLFLVIIIKIVYECYLFVEVTNIMEKAFSGKKVTLKERKLYKWATYRK
jgi:hypothetical protein